MQIQEIAEFTYGEVAEVGNVEPLETAARVSVVHANVEEIGKYLQARFAQTGGFLTDSFGSVTEALVAQDSKLDDMQSLLDEMFEERRRLQVLDGTSEATVSSKTQSATVSPMLRLQVEVVNHSPKELLVYTTLEGGMEVSPATVEVSFLDLSAKMFVPVVDPVTTELSLGTRMISLPDSIKTQHFRVKATSDHTKSETERTALVSFD